MVFWMSAGMPGLVAQQTKLFTKPSILAETIFLMTQVLVKPRQPSYTSKIERLFYSLFSYFHTVEPVSNYKSVLWQCRITKNFKMPTS